MITVNSELLASDWWDRLSKKAQELYLKMHPASDLEDTEHENQTDPNSPAPDPTDPNYTPTQDDLDNLNNRSDQDITNEAEQHIPTTSRFKKMLTYGEENPAHAILAITAVTMVLAVGLGLALPAYAMLLHSIALELAPEVAAGYFTLDDKEDYEKKDNADLTSEEIDRREKRTKSLDKVNLDANGEELDSTDSINPIPSATDPIETNPSATDSINPIPSATDSINPIPSATDPIETNPSATDPIETDPSTETELERRRREKREREAREAREAANEMAEQNVTSSSALGSNLLVKSIMTTLLTRLRGKLNG